MKKSSVWQIIFEFVSVVFAVLLALGLNSYKSHRDLTDQSESLKKRIIEECQLNKQKIDSVIIKNQKTVEYLSAYSEEKDGSLSFSVEDEILLSSAWSFTKSSDAYQYMDASFITSTTEVYELQRIYREYNLGLLDSFGQLMIKSEEASTEVILATANYYLSNVHEICIELQRSYDQFLLDYSTNLSPK